MYHSNLIKSPIEVSPHGSFEVNKLCHSVAICEAVKGDRHNWGNATPSEPAKLHLILDGANPKNNQQFRC